MKMKSLRSLAVAIGATVFLTVAAMAADATGTWTWSTPGRNGGPARKATLTLVQKDGALTGSMPGRGGAVTDITDASIKDDGTIAFSVTRKMGDNSFTTKYTGKLAGDTITGSIEIPGFNGGDPRKIDWTATRGAATDAAAAAPAPAPAQ
jgi:hypothetical protein